MISPRRTFLVARQEFVKYVTRRGFLISLVMMPLLMGLSFAIPRFAASHPRTNVMTVVDLAGGYAPSIAIAVERDHARDTLRDFADYARKYADMPALAKADPALARLLAAPERIASIKAFMDRGGWQPAFEKLHLKPDAPAFDPPKPSIVLVPAPADLSSDFAAGHSEAARAYLEGALSVTALGRPSRLTSIILIPKGFAPGGETSAQYWNLDSQQSLSFIRGALTDAFRLKSNQALVAPGLQDRVTLDVDAPVKPVDASKHKATDWKDQVAKLVPAGLALLLFLVAFSDAALLLQGVVEEKSTRMIEVLLSCAGPHEIMTGKLLGVVALALTTILGWAVIGFAMTAPFSDEAVPVILAGLSGIGLMAPLVLLYFLCGLMIYAALFLGIGATSSSLPDAQALSGPATMVIILPMMLLGPIVQDPNGVLAQVISWIPIYTPFFMLLRLPFHPSAFELWATTLLTLFTTFFLIRQMGRVFARNVLTSERPPSLSALIRQVTGRK
ncbi:ABC-2 type transport system permease protein [Rhizomicrobium palustre]|uniref:ABC-2 type transport system permease protein n=1 Tax=Rhizomicrobium palustre TaxID=189966 RepID=A0A846MZ87_9PROT|nr:ABC transporter permease [Rhizomicrobium palustre]NIK88322.1 ABC-2 type transport system permease protein [Rhizomicrobium palustre]